MKELPLEDSLVALHAGIAGPETHHTKDRMLVLLSEMGECVPSLVS